jgi:hypothetical protein
MIELDVKALQFKRVYCKNKFRTKKMRQAIVVMHLQMNDWTFKNYRNYYRHDTK